MAYSKVVASLLVALFSSLISCVPINPAVINLHNQYIRDRQDVLRLLSMNSGHHKVTKRANHHRRRFWTRPGRTRAWWDKFINGTMIEEEWRENFKMSKTSLLKLAEELRPYIERKETIMRSPLDVVKHVALTLYYLSDEAYFFLTFSVDLDIFSIIYELRLFTPRNSCGVKEMAPKSQLCACSFQDSLR